MLLKCGTGKPPETKEQKWERLKQWHRVFAWWPVPISETECVWLEIVDRRLLEVWEEEKIIYHGDYDTVCTITHYKWEHVRITKHDTEY